MSRPERLPGDSLRRFVRWGPICCAVVIVVCLLVGVSSLRSSGAFVTALPVFVSIGMNLVAIWMIRKLSPLILINADSMDEMARRERADNVSS